MIFEFKLFPIENIYPWGSPPNESLSWFGFTDGEYRLKVGSKYLLNYSEEYTKYLNENSPEYFSTSTLVDYQVVRLWEDILEMLPAILKPVPREIRYFLDSDYKNYRRFSERLKDWQESEIAKGIIESETWDIADLAISWINERWFDNAYLTNSARIWIWSDEKDVIFNWDNREVKVEEIPIWSANYGNYRINKENFINEVRMFDSRLIAEMNERVEIICQNWKKPEIKVDFEQLKNEQENRSTWLDSSLRRTLNTDWNKVISAIKIVNTL